MVNEKKELLTKVIQDVIQFARLNAEYQSTIVDFTPYTRKPPLEFVKQMIIAYSKDLSFTPEKMREVLICPFPAFNPQDDEVSGKDESNYYEKVKKSHIEYFSKLIEDILRIVDDVSNETKTYDMEEKVYKLKREETEQWKRDNWVVEIKESDSKHDTNHPAYKVIEKLDAYKKKEIELY